MRDLETVDLPAGGGRDTSITASGAPRKPRSDKGKMKIKESKNIEKIVVPMSTKKVVKDSEKMKSDKAKLDMMVKQEAESFKLKRIKPSMVMTSLPVPKMLPTVAETNYVKPAPPTKKPRKLRSDKGQPRIKKEKTI